MRISEKKKEKISEQIISLLYEKSPRALFTLHVAQEIARDEEFIKSLLLILKKKKLVVEIKKNPKGRPYTRRSRWRLSSSVYSAYQSQQKSN